MSNIQSYKDLIVWQKAILLVKEIFNLTKSFPKEEIYGLTSQMRRSSVSIPSNIAEGSGRSFLNEWKQFYTIAYGSTLELETQLIISKELNFAKAEDLQKSFELIEEISKMLKTILKNLRAKQLDTNKLVTSI